MKTDTEKQAREARAQRIRSKAKLPSLVGQTPNDGTRVKVIRTNGDETWLTFKKEQGKTFLYITNGFYPLIATPYGHFVCGPISIKRIYWESVASHLNTQAATTAETSTQQGKWDEKHEYEKDLEHESRMDYESDQLAGNPPEYED